MVKFQKERLDEKCTVAYKSDVDKLVVKVTKKKSSVSKTDVDVHSKWKMITNKRTDNGK